MRAGTTRIAATGATTQSGPGLNNCSRGCKHRAPAKVQGDRAEFLQWPRQEDTSGRSPIPRRTIAEETGNRRWLPARPRPTRRREAGRRTKMLHALSPWIDAARRSLQRRAPHDDRRVDRHESEFRMRSPECAGADESHDGDGEPRRGAARDQHAQCRRRSAHDHAPRAGNCSESDQQRQEADHADVQRHLNEQRWPMSKKIRSPCVRGVPSDRFDARASASSPMSWRLRRSSPSRLSPALW